MEPASYEIARYLEAQGIGQFAGDTEFSLHVAREPEKPDNVITLYDTTGGGRLVADGAPMRQPGVQVRVRANDYLEANAMQDRIAALLVQDDQASTNTPLERTIGGSRYVAINPVGDIVSLGRDSSGRHVLTANYQAIRQPVEIST
jgi:minor capsid protein